MYMVKVSFGVRVVDRSLKYNMKNRAKGIRKSQARNIG